jgi:hypothetical protein
MFCHAWCFHCCYVQTGLFLHDFALMRLENLHHFSNVHNFWFIAILHRLSVAALIFCWRLAESDVTVTPVTCMY